jgi:hypothetical protein
MAYSQSRHVTRRVNLDDPGTRSVSTLSPSQLARKRANDREAQRAIRARTKEHIERLERELEEVKSKNPHSNAVQELIRRNKQLEDEIFRLRQSISSGASVLHNGTCRDALPCHRHTEHQNAVFDDSVMTTSLPSPRSSPFPSPIECGTIQDLGPAYVYGSEPCEQWPAGVPPTSVASTVSSPSSTCNAEEYNAGYIPTSAPIMMGSMPSSSMRSGRKSGIKIELEEMDPGTTSPASPPLAGRA